jgi:hypothetical protein
MVNVLESTLGSQGGGARSPAGEGVGESQFQRLEKKLSTLSTLWYKGYSDIGIPYFCRKCPSLLLSPPTSLNGELTPWSKMEQS